MHTSSSTAGRLRDDGLPLVRPEGRTWPTMRRTAELRQLPPPPRAAPPALPPLRRAQNACYEALSLALKEGQVFAALTGPEGCGKTTVLEAVLADRQDRALRCIRIPDADKVPAGLAEQIEQVAYAEAGKPENLERHVVLAVDDAHTASPELLQCLSRLAAMREPGRRVPQILLVGRSELWERLAEEAFEPLARRLAIRAALPALEEDSDPWAVVENDVTATMSQLRAEAERLPTVLAPGAEDLFEPGHEFPSDLPPPETSHEGDDVPPPSAFALFPDPPPAANPSAGRDRRRLAVPLVSLFVGLAAFAFALSFYDWPDLLGDMPWSDPKPSTPFVIPRSPSAQTFGVPLPPVVPAPATPVARSAISAPEPAPPATPPSAPAVSSEPVPQAAPVEPPPTPAAAAPASAPPPTAPEPVAPPPAPSPPAPAPAASPAQASLSPALLALLLRRGDEEMALGDISAARLLYERAAESGSALAARQLARTFDSAFLPQAVEPTLANAGRAKFWYGRSAALGDASAAARLKTLNQGR